MLKILISRCEDSEDVFIAVINLCVAVKCSNFIVLLLNGSSEGENFSIYVKLQWIGCERLLGQVEPLILPNDVGKLREILVI